MRRESVIVVGENVFVVGRSAVIVIRDRSRKDVLVNGEKPWTGIRARGSETYRARPFRGNLHVLIILKTSK